MLLLRPMKVTLNALIQSPANPSLRNSLILRRVGVCDLERATKRILAQ